MAVSRARPSAGVARPPAETAVFLESAEATLVPRARDADEVVEAARTEGAKGGAGWTQGTEGHFIGMKGDEEWRE